MRNSKQEIVDHTILENILAKGTICRLAMMDGDRPYLLAFNYGYKNRCMYIHAAPEGKKIDLLKKNNKICFEIESPTELITDAKPCKWSFKYQSIVGYAHVEIVTDFEEKKRGLDIIMSHYGFEGQPEFADKQVEFIVILKVVIDEMTGKQSSNWG